MSYEIDIPIFKLADLIQEINQTLKRTACFQERRLLALLVALLSAPGLCSLQGKAMKSVAQVVGAIEALLLALLSCRSGESIKPDVVAIHQRGP
jgi:chemotaxis regulatin CheY-phosphate phosphatase CheZ